jgi:hypothetical protein
MNKLDEETVRMMIGQLTIDDKIGQVDDLAGFFGEIIDQDGEDDDQSSISMTNADKAVISCAMTVAFEAIKAMPKEYLEECQEYYKNECDKWLQRH